MALPKAGADRMHALQSARDKDAKQDRPLWSVVDGGYTNRTFIKHLPPRTVFVGRIRSDAKLYHLPESTEGKPGGISGMVRIFRSATCPGFLLQNHRRSNEDKQHKSGRFPPFVRVIVFHFHSGSEFLPRDLVCAILREYR